MTRIISKESISAPSEVSVTGEELHYLTKVRRHREGDAVEVRSTEGRTYQATIGRIERNRAVLRVADEVTNISPVFPVTLVVAVPKRNLMDDVVRKVSEIGVARLIPMWCERSVVRPGSERVDRWRRIAAESLRQCGRESALSVDDPSPFDNAMKAVSGRGTRLILHPSKDGRPFPSNAEPPLTVAIGPEGGFADREIQIASETGFRFVKLNMPILRVETAAIACAVLSVTMLA